MAATPRKNEQIIVDTFDELVIIRDLVRQGRRGWRINDISKSHGRIKVCDLKGIAHKTDADLQDMAIQIQQRAKAYMSEYNAEKRPRLLSEMAKPDKAEVEAIFGNRPPVAETAVVPPIPPQNEPTLFDKPNGYWEELSRLRADFRYLVSVCREQSKKLDMILNKI